MEEKKTNICAVCGKTYDVDELTAGTSIRDQVSDLIKADHPDWSTSKYVCESDLAEYRLKYVTAMLREEKGALSTIEEDVLNTMQNHELISENIESQFDKKWSFGERMSDKIADFGGSWTFIIIFMAFMGIWILFNTYYLFFRPFDPFPYILLNLLLSTLAAIQAPIIMMSQNRQEAKDRVRSQNDYKVNLKAELEIRTLHEKLDHMLTYQWDRMMQIQEMQMELLNAIQQKTLKSNNQDI